MEENESKLERIMARRFATYTDIPEKAYLWKPYAIPPALASDLNVGAEKKVAEIVDIGNITFAKLRSILSTTKVTKMEVLCDNPKGRIINSVTVAKYKDEKPMLIWDKVSGRNTAAFYAHEYDDPISNWGVEQDTWVNVPGIVIFPHLWAIKYDFDALVKSLFGIGATFLCEGMRDVAYIDDTSCTGLGIFNDYMKTDILLEYGVDEVERVATSSRIEYTGDPQPCGVSIIKLGFANVKLRFTRLNGSTVSCVVDRWE